MALGLTTNNAITLSIILVFFFRDKELRKTFYRPNKDVFVDFWDYFKMCTSTTFLFIVDFSGLMVVNFMAGLISPEILASSHVLFTIQTACSTLILAMNQSAMQTTGFLVGK